MNNKAYQIEDDEDDEDDNEQFDDYQLFENTKQRIQEKKGK